MMPVGIVIVSGIPGAGKTTVARALADRFSRSVHLEGDVIGHDFIVAGLVPPEGCPRAEADRQLALRRRNIALLADSFAADGYLTVIDDVVVSRDVLATYRRLLTARPVRFVQLLPAVEAVRARDAARDKRVFGTWSHLDGVVRDWPPPRPGIWVDSSDISAEQTVDTLVENWADSVIL